MRLVLVIGMIRASTSLSYAASLIACSVSGHGSVYVHTAPTYSGKVELTLHFRQGGSIRESGPSKLGSLGA
jgi:hypothetical protein